MGKLKTAALLGGLTALVLAVGYYFGGEQGALIALVISAVMNFGSYWFSDKIVLSMYKAKEIPSGERPDLHAMVDELARNAGIPKPRLYMVDLPVPNAFATGRNEKHAAVAVTQGILSILDANELRAVLAHELSHVKNRDILISSVAATLAGAISYLAQMVYFTGALGGRSNGDSRGGGNALGAIAILILTPVIATLLHLAVSRSREYMADETGARISGDPRSLASALRKLHRSSLARPLAGEPKYEATAHLFIVNPFKSSLIMSLFSTHPPVDERIRRLEEI
jgi:heat shock protein HtpX